MKRFSFALLTGAVAAFLFTGTAQAAPVPWTYNFTPSTLKVVSDAPTSFITLTNEPGRIVNTDHTFVTATNVTVTSDAPTGFPDEFSTNGGVTFGLFLKDNVSAQSTTINFTGTFATTDLLNPSQVTSESSDLQFTPTGNQNVTQVLGNNEYHVFFKSYTPPGPPNSGNKGSIAYRVTVRNLDIQKAPEPATMLLAGLGASLMSFSAWRKRRKLAAIA